MSAKDRGGKSPAFPTMLKHDEMASLNSWRLLACAVHRLRGLSGRFVCGIGSLRRLVSSAVALLSRLAGALRKPIQEHVALW
jgi:hypothetical protein